MDLLASALAREVQPLKDSGVRICFIGDRSRMSDKVRAGFAQAEAETLANTHIVLNICFNYGGRWDIAQAATKLVASGLPMTEDNLHKSMSLAHVPDPDLVIRTGGEYRISNFLLWQSAYSELHFTQTLWPDFDESALELAMADYAGRERRFGKTSEQVAVNATVHAPVADAAVSASHAVAAALGPRAA